MIYKHLFWKKYPKICHNALFGLKLYVDLYKKSKLH